MEWFALDKGWETFKVLKNLIGRIEVSPIYNYINQIKYMMGFFRLFKNYKNNCCLSYNNHNNDKKHNNINNCFYAHI